MNLTDDMKAYISLKVGIDNFHAFDLWAFIGTKKNKLQGSLIDKWNAIHATDKIKRSMNIWDAVDRMIDIWKERFG